MTPRKNPVHTTETTYMDGVQVVRLIVSSKGFIGQSTSTDQYNVLPFKTKPYNQNIVNMDAVLKIDRKISRVRQPAAKPTTNTKQ